MKNKNNKFIVLLFCLIASFVFCGHEDVLAYTATITTNSNIVMNITPAAGGVSIHEESINVASDCRNGYNLSIATPSGSSLYKYENDTPAGTASFTAVDGTSALSDSNNTNKWGYTLTSNPTASTVFSPLSTTASTLKTSAQTADPTADINDTFSINYGIQVDKTINPGNYQMSNHGVIVYYLTMDTVCTQYTIAYNANGGTGSMGNQNMQEGEPANINAQAFTAPSGASYTDANNNTITGDADKLWVFWGWNTAADGTGDWYKDKESVEDLTTAGSTVTLYAQWKQATLSDMTAGTPVGTEKVIDHNLMQDMLPETCYNSAITTAANAPAATLLDYRGKVTTGENPEQPESYTVSKLPDGLCWMTKNLNLGRSSGGPNGNGTITLTPDDTDITTTFTLPAGDTTSYTSTTNLAKIRVTNSSSASTNGVYYTWAAAVANTNAITTNPTTSICPKGWDLPSYTQYENLATKASYSSSNRPTAAPSSFLASGGFTDGATFYQTSYSHFWTNNSSFTTIAYGARVNSTTMTTSSTTGTTYGSNKYYRKNIRCIASLGRVTINYDGNGTNEYPVTGTTASQENVEINAGTTVRTSSFSRNGWFFNSWNTAPDGSGTTIAAGASLSSLNLKPGNTITLYAQWLPQYTITYVNNCQTYVNNNASCTQTVSNGTGTQKINMDASGDGSGTLGASNFWTLTGWKIKGWSTVADNSSGTYTEYPASSTYTVTGQSAGSGITLYAHWVPVYSIQYDGNGASNSNGMGTTDANGVKSVKQTNVGEGTPVTLLASNFKRANYGFVGWSTDSNAWTHFTDNDNTNDPIIYGPMETISAPAHPNNANNILTLYAVWVPAETSGGNPVYLQDFGSAECASLTSTTFNSTTGEITPGSVLALTDKRDNQVYTIAKLADGKCWMVENLRLDDQYTVGNNINDPTVTNESLSQGYGKYSGTGTNYGDFVGLANPETTNFSNTTTANSLYSTSTSGDKMVIGTSYAANRIPRYNNSNTYSLVDSTTYTQNYINSSGPTESGTNYNKLSNVYSYGNYYTWAAAMANTGHYEVSSVAEAAGTSICPTGWTLPTGGSATKDFGLLSQAYGGTGGSQDGANNGDTMYDRFRTFPNNFIIPGYRSYSSVYTRGERGNYWSRSKYDSTSAYYLDFGKQTNFDPSARKAPYYGNSVRCVVVDPYTVTVDFDDHVQSVSFSHPYYGVQTVTNSGDTVLLSGKEYTISATYDTDYALVLWTTTNGGTLGSVNSPTTTYKVSSDTTLSVTSKYLPYTIQYDGNGASNSNGMGTTNANGVKSVKQTSVSEGDQVTLLPSNFKRSGHSFAGWSTDSNAWAHFTDNDSTNDSRIYGPMETISAPAHPNNANNILTLYAVWVPAETSGGNPVYLQDFGSAECASLTSATFDSTTGEITPGSVIALTDKRDNQVYTIAKLADGKCWMVENLRVGHDGTTGNNINDSSVTNESLSQGYGGTPGTYGSFVGLADAETNLPTSASTANSIYKSDGSHSTFDSTLGTLEDIGTTDSPTYRFPRYNDGNTNNIADSTTYIQDYINASSPINSGTNYITSLNIYSYGNYYTWAAAMANTKPFSKNPTVSEAAGTSICPFGWVLPTSGTTTKNFGNLSKAYGGSGGNQSSSSVGAKVSERIRAFPNNFVLAGSGDSVGRSEVGTVGYYWSRTTGSNYDQIANHLYLAKTGIDASRNFSNNKNAGHSVRCIVGS